MVRAKKEPVTTQELSTIDQHAARVKARGGRNYAPRGGLLLYSWDNGASPNEHSYRCEALFLTPRQSLYLSIIVGCGPSKVALKVPFTVAEATEWLSSHVPAIDAMNIPYFFDTLAQRVKFNTTLIGFLSFAVAKRAEEAGVSSSQVIEEIFLKEFGFSTEKGVFGISADRMEALSGLKEMAHSSDAVVEGIRRSKARPTKVPEKEQR